MNSYLNCVFFISIYSIEGIDFERIDVDQEEPFF